MANLDVRPSQLFEGVVCDHVDERAWVTLDNHLIISAKCQLPLPPRGSVVSIRVKFDTTGFPKSAEVMAIYMGEVTQWARELGQLFWIYAPSHNLHLVVKEGRQAVDAISAVFCDLIDQGVLK